MDATGARRRVSRAAIERALAAMGAGTPAPDGDAGPVFARAGERLPRGVRAIELEGGGEARPGERLPRATPAGYHRLHMRDGSRRLLVTSPGRCHLPALDAWGWAAQLYAVRSATSWGIGDLADLRTLQRWSQTLGAGALLLNPLHAPRATLPQEPSPYFPSSRRFRNPLYIAVEEVPGARRHGDVALIAAQARGLNATAVIDRDRIYALKMHALARLWEGFAGDAGFDAYCAAGGDELLRYACFCALTDRHQGSWRTWPERYRHPRSEALHRLAHAERRRVDFHRWLQWLLEVQLQGDGGDGGAALIHDLAVGFAPDGADAWEWQDLLAPGMSVGAPPDEYLLAGQDWGLPPFDPHKLRAAGYAPLRATLRALMRAGHGVRIDHVMGLFRLWWVPRDGGPADGVYVRFPARELLDIVALESARAGAFVVGEDLGTVENGVRAELHRRAILSYRVAWFESRSPRGYPPQAVAAMTTHDLPTVAGVWTGADVREMQELGVKVNLPAEARLRRRLQRLAGVGDAASVSDVIARAYAAMSETPSIVTLATLDDATAAERRPNIPGTISRPNWSIPLPRTLEQLRHDRLPRRIAAELSQAR
ncbi:MAG TPA: 4-alpha-glucanotransferase [Candidatus Dormibacteraeota bacterium]